MMNEIDVLCIDIQDVGSRYYTYLYTMSYAMEALQEIWGKNLLFLIDLTQLTLVAMREIF